jgi:hypothetical protein
MQAVANFPGAIYRYKKQWLFTNIASPPGPHSQRDHHGKGVP